MTVPLNAIKAIFNKEMETSMSKTSIDSFSVPNTRLSRGPD